MTKYYGLGKTKQKLFSQPGDLKVQDYGTSRLGFSLWIFLFRLAECHLLDILMPSFSLRMCVERLSLVFTSFSYKDHQSCELGSKPLYLILTTNALLRDLSPMLSCWGLRLQHMNLRRILVKPKQISFLRVICYINIWIYICAIKWFYHQTSIKVYFQKYYIDYRCLLFSTWIIMTYTENLHEYYM